MKDNELQFDRSCHVLYSKPCKKEILAKIALHYPAAEREAVWEQVQRQYVDFLSYRVGMCSSITTTWPSGPPAVSISCAGCFFARLRRRLSAVRLAIPYKYSFSP